MLRRKFAVVKLWPGVRAAEDECIARLKVAAKSLDLECIEVDSFARVVDSPHVQLTQEDVDFVLSLHYDTPKSYDIFSFVALWNPLQFYHQFGYRRCTRNLLTHDDFLSCSSPWADDQVRRLVASDPMREGPNFHLYHSLSEPILPPTTGDGKLFYVGINWELLGKGPQRHGKLLEMLDQTGDLRIYGPKIFGGVDVWAGFKSYIGPVAFDGVSIVRLINQAGVSLVLSSEAHRQSELMSSRLFESLAAGAVIICDDNPFAHRFFGETLLYIDGTLGAEEMCEQVQSHLAWIKSEPAKAKELAKQAQEIFLRDFALDLCLQKIYDGLPARKRKLESLYAPKRSEERVTVVFLMPEFQPEVLDRHIASCLAQKSVAVRPILAMDKRDFELLGHRVQTRLAGLPTPMEVRPLDYFEECSKGKGKLRRRTGHVLHQAIDRLVEDDYFCIVYPHERLFSDHLCSLLHILQDHGEVGSAWAGMLLSLKNNGDDRADLSEEADCRYRSEDQPLGCGRFLFRKSALPPGLETVLPYLDALPANLLLGVTRSLPSGRCTVALDIEDRFHRQIVERSHPKEELEILIDYAPSVFGNVSIDDGAGVAPGLSLEAMTPEQKTKLAVELAHSVPVPVLLKKILFGVYRAWFRLRNTRT